MSSNQEYFSLSNFFSLRAALSGGSLIGIRSPGLMHGDHAIYCVMGTPIQEVIDALGVDHVPLHMSKDIANLHQKKTQIFEQKDDGKHELNIKQEKYFNKNNEAINK